MARSNRWLPRPLGIMLRKSDLLASLRKIDKSKTATRRVLALETDFRQRIRSHINSMPTAESNFKNFNTSPFVLMIHCMKRNYSRISQIESDILPAKEFSSMETSAGRMVEAVALPIYGWKVVQSEMHSPHSILDGECLQDRTRFCF